MLGFVKKCARKFFSMDLNMENGSVELSCRVCWEMEGPMVHIFEEVDDLQTNLDDLLEQCGGIKVDRNDPWPKYLCKDCTNELLIAAKFREKCACTEQVLAQLVQGTLQPLPETENIADEDEEEFKRFFAEISARQEQSVVEGVVKAELKDEESHKEETVSEVTDIVVPQDVMEEAAQLAMLDNFEAAQRHLTDDDYIVFDANEIEEDVTKSPTDFSQDSYVPNVTVPQATPYTCDVCGAYFRISGNLHRHMARTHSPAQFFECARCNHCFSSASAYETHIADCLVGLADVETENMSPKSSKHHKQRNATCTFCGKAFNGKFALNMHLRSHTGERPFVCELCGKSYKTQGALTLHSKRHSNVPQYACGICDKTFYEKGNMNVHMRSHTGEKPHVCNICGRSFTRVFLLKLHRRTHTGEKPYQCSVCPRAFKQRGDLHNHLASHMPEREYKCNLCDREFTLLRYLRTHMKSHGVLFSEDFVEIEETATSCDSSQMDDMDLAVEGDYINFDEIIEEEV